MTWRIELTAKARKQLSKIDRHAAHRIVKFLRHLENLEEPRQQGKALQGQLAELTSTAPPAARRRAGLSNTSANAAVQAARDYPHPRESRASKP